MSRLRLPRHAQRWAERALLAALAALPCLIMARPLWRGAIPFFMDPAMYFFPLRAQAARVLAAGEWPLWNRAIMGGMPLLANPQSAVVYPLNWPSLAWPNGFWFTFPQVLQLGLYGALTAWALRRAGVSLAAAAWAGALALAGGHGWSRLQFGNFMNVLPWWPLWLGAALASARSSARTSAWTALGSVAVAMLLLSGAHQPAAYGLAALALTSLAMAAMEPRGRRRSWIVFVAATFACGVMLAAPGWLPQAAFLRETARPGGLAARQVLDGTVGSLRQLATSLLGDWPRGLAVLTGHGDALPGGRWADAEGQADLGLIALVLALVPPRPGRRRRLWGALWIAALATALLASRPAMALLLRVVPATGVFHDPRRWLGVTQWLLLMASGLGADRLWRAAGRRGDRAGKLVLAAMLVVAVAAQGWLTGATTCLTMIPASALIAPKPTPLLARVGLRPGERFFSLDWQRASSYDFRRPDLIDWALPNLAMLWGYEDLGGYEPAQSRRWRAFMDELSGPDPWRRLWPDHFALVATPWRPELFAPANVRAAILPRWGVPLYFRQLGHGDGAAWGALLPPLSERMDLLAVLEGGDGASLALRNGLGDPPLPLSKPQPLSLADDLAWRPATIDSAAKPPQERPAPPGQGRLRATRGALTLSPAWAAEAARTWFLAISGQPRPGETSLVDLYGWTDALAAAWKPVAGGSIATLLATRRPGSRTEWIEGSGRVLGETIRHNRLDLTVEVTSPGGATLVVGDAWWPGWRARLETGRPVLLTPSGPWRAARLPVGRHVLTMTYVPDGLPLALVLTLAGLVGALLASRRRHERAGRGAK